MVSPDFTDLQTKGFVVIPNFLSDPEIRQIVADFNRQPPGAIAHYNHGTASAEMNEQIKSRLQETLATILQQTDLRVDFTWGGIYFATGRGINFSWHQDHEAYFSFQDYYDYLNFYIPVVKPRRDKSNLSIIPFDVLERECPDLYRRVVRKGASRFIRMGRSRLVCLDDEGTIHVMRKEAEAIAVTPQLGEGDLLLMRGDMIHRTQDTETNRVALSFRASNSHAVVTRARLADGSMYKARMMAKNADYSQRMFLAFDQAGSDSMTAHELYERMRTVQLEQPKRGAAFMRYLLGQKRRAGVLGHFFPRAVVSAMAMRWASILETARPKERPEVRHV